MSNPTRFYRVLATADQAPAERRMREWCELGQPFVADGFWFSPITVHGELRLAVWRHASDDGESLWDRDPDSFDLGPLPTVPLQPLQTGDYTVIPRAVEELRPACLMGGDQGKPVAVLFEFQYTGLGRACWHDPQPTTMEGHHA